MPQTPPAPASHRSGPHIILRRGELHERGYHYRTVKQELRENAITKLRSGEPIFPGILGYEHSVIPQLIQGVLSAHDLLLLGLRGQAKTRLLRAMIDLLDEWVPIIDAEGVDVPDDPMHPTTRIGREVVDQLGNETPIRWLHRSQRYHEKLATPDVTVADLIGEIDLIKHAEGRNLSDERTIHYGLIPHANRGIFVMNELPDLAPRIQVALFNVLEERDVQIRGYPIRLELDLALMFSANPEDYTNRGRIVTPLKDRIGTVVRTHYPTSNELAMCVARENAFINRTGESARVRNARSAPAQLAHKPDDSYRWAAPPGSPRIDVPRIMHEIIEETIRQARTSPHINQASGVSVRASICALESLISAAEARALRTGESITTTRICDTAGLPAALRGKIELMIAEDASSGASTEDRLIVSLFGESLKRVLARHVDIDDIEHITDSFTSGLRIELSDRASAPDALSSMRHVDGLIDAAKNLASKIDLDAINEQHLACAGELILECLYVNNRLSKAARPEGGTATSYMR